MRRVSDAWGPFYGITLPIITETNRKLSKLNKGGLCPELGEGSKRTVFSAGGTAIAAASGHNTNGKTILP